MHTGVCTSIRLTLCHYMVRVYMGGTQFANFKGLHHAYVYASWILFSKLSCASRIISTVFFVVRYRVLCIRYEGVRDFNSKKLGINSRCTLKNISTVRLWVSPCDGAVKHWQDRYGQSQCVTDRLRTVCRRKLSSRSLQSKHGFFIDAFGVSATLVAVPAGSACWDVHWCYVP